ncbi:MAG: phosphoribosylanthranilate isomerase [Lentisphaerota bacterium]
MSVFVKICGLTSEKDVEAVVRLKPDAIGFVFWAKSKRHVTADAVGAWAGLIPGTIQKVGVFADAAMDEVLETVRIARLDVVQLHFFQSLENAPENFPIIGKLHEDFSNHWKNPPRLWQVLHLRKGVKAGPVSEHVDAVLIDSYSADLPGGTGHVGDWVRARDFVERSAKPVLLAGGLTRANIQEALRAVRPWGVDVSSGVELSPGKKDLSKVKDFIELCRSA